jgi:hypothetical protein
MNDKLREWYLEDIRILEGLMEKMNKSSERYAFCKRELSRRKMALSVDNLKCMEPYLEIPSDREMRGCGDCTFSTNAHGGYSCDFNDNADERNTLKYPCKYHYTPDEIKSILIKHWNQ